MNLVHFLMLRFCRNPQHHKTQNQFEYTWRCAANKDLYQLMNTPVTRSPYVLHKNTSKQHQFYWISKWCIKRRNTIVWHYKSTNWLLLSELRETTFGHMRQWISSVSWLNVFAVPSCLRLVELRTLRYEEFKNENSLS